MTFIETAGKFIADLETERLPETVAEKARTCLLNGYGIGLGCLDTPYAPVARAAALALDGRVQDGASLLGYDAKVSVSGAALANAALFHGRGQEDTCGAAHFGAILIPMLTAMIEARRYPLDQMIPALVAGYEVGGVLEQALSDMTTPWGFRSSPLYGTIAAAAAASRLMSLSPERTAAAFGNAAAFTGGTMQTFHDGSDEWRYQVGWAARNGLLAAELAAHGSVAARHAIEGPAGFSAVFAGVKFDADAMSARLGKEWSIHRVTFKPYPVCAFNQTPVMAALELGKQIRGRAIRSARVRMNPFEAGYAGMSSKGPFSTIGGTLMSIPFCIALTLLKGSPTLQTMATYDDATVNDLMQRMDLIADDSVPRLCCVIEAELGDGTMETIDKRITAEDFNFDRGTVGKLVRRIGEEQQVPAAAYDLIENFVDTLPSARIEDVVAAFKLRSTAMPSSADVV